MRRSLETLSPVDDAKPIAIDERVAQIDVIRGLALGGVLLTNLLTSFRIPLSAHILHWDGPLGAGGVLIAKLLRVLIEFKAFTLFSFLFGVGVAIQVRRVCERSRNWFLFRRFGSLLAIGIIHMLFIWNGDILALYAICGLALIPLLALPEFALIVLGIGLVFGPNIALFIVEFPATATLKSLTLEALRAYGHGTLPELFAFRLHETQLLIVPLVTLSMPRTLGLMLMGVAAWRKGWLVENQNLWRWSVILGAGGAIAGQWLGLDEAVNLGLALVYIAVLLLWNPRARWIAAAGRMALTNYLLQSVIFGFVFYSYGLGWIGQVGLAAALVGGVTFYCIQLAMSQRWLERFRFGPFEWMWRSVTYMRWQPFVNEGDITVSRAAARVVLVAVFGAAVPLVHLGIPMLLARVGPHWGWTGGRPTAMNFLGLVVILAGELLLFWIAKTMLHKLQDLPSRVRLGLRPEALVQTGPYAWMRHPMYVAECCLWIGTIVLFGSPLTAMVFVSLLVVAVPWVLRVEERALEEQFGEKYREYRGRVPKIPRFWQTGL